MRKYIKPRIIAMTITPVSMIASSINSRTPVSGIDNSMGYGGENDGTHTVGSAKYHNIWAEECGEE